MQDDSSQKKSAADLLALAAAANGNAARRRMAGAEPIDVERERRIAELKRRYQNGDLNPSADQIARKIIDAHLDRP